MVVLAAKLGLILLAVGIFLSAFVCEDWFRKLDEKSILKVACLEVYIVLSIAVVLSLVAFGGP